MEMNQLPSPNPLEHAKNIENILSSLKDLCRSETDVFDDPKAKALLETTAEVLAGLERAFHEFLAKNEDVWKDEFEVLPQRSIDPWD
jgi:hypothetical protein